MLTTQVQTNFTGGELSPRLTGRSDLKKFFTSAETIDNFVTLPQGCAIRRSGTQYIASTKDSTKTSRLIPFQVSTNEAFIIEFGDLYVRFFKNGAAVLDPVTGVPYEVVSPYTEDNLAEIRFAQSADILFLTHPTVTPKQLNHYGDTQWTFTDYVFNDGPYLTVVDGAENVTAPISQAAGTVIYSDGIAGYDNWKSYPRNPARAFDSDNNTKAERNGGYNKKVWIGKDWSGATTRTIGKVDILYYPVTSNTITVRLRGSTDKSGWVTLATVTDSNNTKHTLTISQGITTTTAYAYHMIEFEGNFTDSAAPRVYEIVFYNLISAAVPVVKVTSSGASGYVLGAALAFTSDIGIFNEGHIGSVWRLEGASSGEIAWVRITAVATSTAATATAGVAIPAELQATNAASYREGVWSDIQGFPRSVIFFQGRMWLASTVSQPQTLWGSVVGDYNNFAPTGLSGVELGVAADDNAVTVTIDDDQVNAIRWMQINDKGLLVGTQGGEYIVSAGGINQPITPTSLFIRRQGVEGSRDTVQPVQAGPIVFHVQPAGKTLHGIQFDFNIDQFDYEDLTIFADHIAQDRIAGMVVQREPYLVIWVYLDDGSLRSMTYDRKHEIVAWNRHTLGGSGLVESLAVIRNSAIDEVWMVVKRTTTRYVEKLTDFFPISDGTIPAGFFLDSGVKDTVTSGSIVTGLGHVSGMTVDALVDGVVVPGLVVSGAVVDVGTSGTTVQVGLPYTSTIKTLPLTPSQLSVMDPRGKNKNLYKIFIELHNTVNGKFGRDASNLDSIVYQTEDAALYSGLKECALSVGSDRTVQYVIAQNEPLPMTILSVIQEFNVGGV